MSEAITRYPNESAVAFANRRLRAQGRADVEWIQTRDGRMILQHAVHKQASFDV